MLSDETAYRRYLDGEEKAADLLVERYGDALTLGAIVYLGVFHLQSCPVHRQTDGLLFYLLIFEPKPRELPGLALAIAVGFATFENVCYLTENGAEDFTFLPIRGISAGALHILYGVLSGYGIAHVFRHRWLALTGTVGILGACIGFHGIYNLPITAQGAWKMAGYLFPSALIVCLFVVRQLLPRLKISFE